MSDNNNEKKCQSKDSKKWFVSAFFDIIKKLLKKWSIISDTPPKTDLKEWLISADEGMKSTRNYSVAILLLLILFGAIGWIGFCKLDKFCTNGKETPTKLNKEVSAKIIVNDKKMIDVTAKEKENTSLNHCFWIILFLILTPFLVLLLLLGSIASREKRLIQAYLDNKELDNKHEEEMFETGAGIIKAEIKAEINKKSTSSNNES